MSTQDPRSATGRNLNLGPSARDQSARPTPPLVLPFNPDADRFDVPDRVKRPGFRCQWVRKDVLGQPDNKNISQALREGWRPVPGERWLEHDTNDFGDLLPKTGNIEQEGLVLMERREDYCQAVEAYNHNKTAAQTAARDAALGESSDPKNFPRTQPRHSETVEGPVSGPSGAARATDGEDYN